MIDPTWAPRKLTHAQARLEQLLDASRMSLPERLAAARALTERMYKLQGIDFDEREADFTPHRVPRSPR